MAFPEVKVEKGFLFNLEKKDGWECLGERQGREEGNMVRFMTHSACNDKVHVGKEDGEIFIYCKRCMIKVG